MDIQEKPLSQTDNMLVESSTAEEFDREFLEQYPSGRFALATIDQLAARIVELEAALDAVRADEEMQRLQFQRETRRTSELMQMLREVQKVLNTYREADGKRYGIRWPLSRSIDDLLNKPLEPLARKEATDA